MTQSINDEFREDVNRAVADVQLANGRPRPVVFTDAVRPVGDIPGFTAEDGVAATRLLERKWGCPFGDNIFLSWGGTEPQTLKEIVGELMNLQAHGY